MGFDFSFYIRVIRRWLWLIILASVVVGGTVYFILNQREDLYETSALLNVGSSLYSLNPDFNDLRIGQELTETYAYLVGTSSIHEAAAVQLGNVVSTEDIEDSLSTRIILDTSLFEIIILYHDPVLAASIANAISDQLVIQSPTNLTPQLQTQIELSQSQINLLSTYVEDLQTQSNAINIRIDEAEAQGNTQEADVLSSQVSDIISQINQATSTIASFSSNITAIEQRANSISIQERASVPTSPIDQNSLLFTAIAILGTGGLLASAVIFISALDTSIQNEAYVKNNLDLPIHGKVSVAKRNNGLYSGRDSNKLEAYDMLRINLLYREKKATHCYIMASPTDEENTSSVVGNLAIAAATGGLRVLVIDGDLRNPELHKLLNTQGQAGLIEVLKATPQELDNLSLADLMRNYTIRLSSSNQLHFMVSDVKVKNAIQLMESPTMLRLLEKLIRSEKFDFILINMPPALTYPETSAFATQTELETLLIVQQGKTRTEDIKSTVEQLQKVNANIAGTIYVN